MESFLNLLRNQALRETTRSKYCDGVRSLSEDGLVSYVQQIIPGDKLHPIVLYDFLPSNRRTDAYQATVMVYYLSKQMIIPHTTQLEATLCPIFGQDCIFIAPTGFGKTIVVIMGLPLHPREESLLLAPLKRLQQCQVSFSLLIRSVVASHIESYR